MMRTRCLDLHDLLVVPNNVDVASLSLFVFESLFLLAVASVLPSCPSVVHS